jgi:hypothetical protein
MTEDDFTKGDGAEGHGRRCAAQGFPRKRSGVFRDVRVGRLGHRIAWSRQLRRRQGGPGRLRALPTGAGFAESHNRLGPMVSGDGRRTQAEKDLRAAGDRAHHACGGRAHPRSSHQPKIPNVVAISADWVQARRAGIGGRVPPMFSESGTAETSSRQAIQNHRCSTSCQLARGPEGWSWSPAVLNKSPPRFLRSLPSADRQHLNTVADHRLPALLAARP